MNRKRIGFIGLGVMGSRMTRRLLNAGYEVIVYNRTPEKMGPILQQGATAASDISSLAKQSDVICTCLSMPSDVKAVYEGPDGILANSRPQTVCIDFTTVGMDTSIDLANQAKAKQIDYLDAPVSGGPEGAEQGSLTIMVGGNKTAFEQVSQILNVLGQNIQYLGDSGLGSVAKLINQYLVAAHSLAASEAMVTGVALGLRAEQLYDILRTSYGDSRMLRRHMETYVLPRNFEPGGALKYVLKDVNLAIELFAKIGLQPRTGNSAVEVLNLAVEQGLADLDMSAIIQPLEKQCEVVVKKQSGNA
ncbi:NAD(P)-dependent oxidoreductase [Effusibacillus dendaii]|uniref:Putative oxidoreductase YkwC n=1 Tax=Effusibacillus dendaii TaxID=2743772 RepID=A0A7I8D5T4_9BACL|nr:NAD(P)-dependent oxidoreductase [Effusibacillus dendaii]BCJ85494.1 putative oxidoreductase YkwC [Effusibacillus dendaii]